jgi:hypothetical protein
MVGLCQPSNIKAVYVLIIIMMLPNRVQSTHICIINILLGIKKKVVVDWTVLEDWTVVHITCDSNCRHMYEPMGYLEKFESRNISVFFVLNRYNGAEKFSYL